MKASNPAMQSIGWLAQLTLDTGSQSQKTAEPFRWKTRAN